MKTEPPKLLFPPYEPTLNPQIKELKKKETTKQEEKERTWIWTWSKGGQSMVTKWQIGCVVVIIKCRTVNTVVKCLCLGHGHYYLIPGLYLLLRLGSVWKNKYLLQPSRVTSKRILLLISTSQVTSIFFIFNYLVCYLTCYFVSSTCSFTCYILFSLLNIWYLVY